MAAYREVGGARVYLRKWAYTTVISERGLRRRVLLPMHMVEHMGWGVDGSWEVGGGRS